MTRPNKMQKITFVVLVFFTTTSSVLAQRTWIELEISKDIVEKLEIALAPEIRFKENFELHEYFFEPKIEYDFNKYFSLGANYRFGNNPDKKGTGSRRRSPYH